VKKFSVLVYRCRRLRPGVAIRGSEIKRADAVRAEGARECRATTYRFDCVVSHPTNFIPWLGLPWRSLYDYSLGSSGRRA
jgi:hypothetical protein